MRNITFIVFVLVSIITVLSTSAHAFEEIDDDFSSKDETNWYYTEKDGFINFNEGYVILGSTGPTFPLMERRLINGIFDNDLNSAIELRFKYNDISPSGSGIGIGFTGLGGKPFYLFGVWADSASNSILILSNNYLNSDYKYCSEFIDQPSNSEIKIIFPANDFLWHKLRIEKVSEPFSTDKYYVYFDKDINPFPIINVEYGGCNPTNIWFGNPLSVNNSWSSFSVDYLKTLYLGGDPVKLPTSSPIPTITGSPQPSVAPTTANTPIPTPTNVPNNRRKIFFVPGMGASWNTEALVYNTVVDDNLWKMTPFVDNYNSFFRALEANGFVKDIDYFVWNYDWRRPLQELVDKFDNYVDSKIGPNDTYDIVGHSMGGVVARVWLQQHDNSRVGKVISAGSPQRGAIDTYVLWNGAQIAGEDNVASTALNILVQLQKKNNRTKLETLREFAPGIRDLLPIFDFAKKGNKLISVADLTYKNNFLPSVNTTVNSVYSKYKSVVGIGEKTVSFVKLGERNENDKAIGYWPDGVIKDYSYGNGDGTVLIKSATFEGDEYYATNSNHGDIIKNGVSEILNSLELNNRHYILGDSNNYGLIYYIGSPAFLRANCLDGDSKQSDNLGFLILNKDDVCKVSIVGTGNGTYHLAYGDYGKNTWSYIENEIKLGETVNLSNINDWKNIIRRDLKSIGLNKLFPALDENDYKKVLTGVIKYRKQTGETVVTERIVDSLLEIVSFKKNLHQVLTVLYGRMKEREFNDNSKRKYSFIDSVTYQKTKEIYAKMNYEIDNNHYDKAWGCIQMAEMME